MALFKKNNQLVEVLNKINTVENKIDILNNKLESVTFMDGCCDCKKRETKIYSDLQEYLDDQLLHIRNSLLESINENFAHKQSEDSDSSSDMMEGLENLEHKLKTIIEDVYTKHRNELLETLQKCCENKSTKTDILDLCNNMNTLLLQTKNDILEKYRTTDLSLRTDLQTFLVGLQKELNTNFHGQNETFTTKLNSYNEELNNRLLDLNKLLNSVKTSVNGFYYENELIKHQLVLEDDIRKYNDEIENIKLLATNMKNSIDSILSDYEFEK